MTHQGEELRFRLVGAFGLVLRFTQDDLFALQIGNVDEAGDIAAIGHPCFLNLQPASIMESDFPCALRLVVLGKTLVDIQHGFGGAAILFRMTER